MRSSDYARVMRTHPNKAEVLYSGVSALGLYEETAVEIFQDGIKRIYEKKLTVVTETFPPINKKLHPTILINGNTMTIQDHYSENKFLTVVTMQ